MSSSSAVPWTVALQAPLSMGFTRQEYWSGLPFLSLRDLPNPGIEPTSPTLAGRFFTASPPGKPINLLLKKIHHFPFLERERLCFLYCLKILLKIRKLNKIKCCEEWSFSSCYTNGCACVWACAYI